VRQIAALMCLTFLIRDVTGSSRAVTLVGKFVTLCVSSFDFFPFRCIWQARVSDSFSTIASRFPPANWLQVWFMNPAILHPDSALQARLVCF
jgi:hypothetical protein